MALMKPNMIFEGERLWDKMIRFNNYQNTRSSLRPTLRMILKRRLILL
jgi:hypothetical protein